MTKQTDNEQTKQTDNEQTKQADNEQTKQADSISLADATAQIEKMLADAKKVVEAAKAEAKKIIADAKKSADGELTEEQKQALEKEKAYYDELVPIELFKDNGKYKDDVYVSVNGENCVIKRGEKVMIKRKFALVLEQSLKQDNETNKLIEQKSNEFAKSEF